MKQPPFSNHPLHRGLPTNGAAIEERSFDIISAYLDKLECSDDVRPIIHRIVHATADVSIAQTMRIHPNAIAKGVMALQKGAPVFTDVKMLQVGITRTAGPIRCAIDDADIIRNAKAAHTTRAAMAMASFGEALNGAIVAIGNAPTAIWQLLSMSKNDGIVPALVVGLPVGFVGATESKQALWESGLVTITNQGPRGGSALAAAAVNALAILSRKANSSDV